MGAGAVKAYPAVFPGLLFVCRISDQLAGAGKKQVSGADLPSAPAYLKHSLAGKYKVDEVVVPDAGSPGLSGSATLNAAIEDGQLNVIGVILLEGLLINVCHVLLFLRPVTF